MQSTVFTAAWWPANGIIYQAGMSSAVWEIGDNAICKVKTWTEGMEVESRTLAFVASRFPHMPLPEEIYSCVDEKLERSFLILRRAEGQTLEKAWQSLTSDQRSSTAATIAQSCYDMAGATSENLQSATGCRVLEPFLNVRGEDSHPTWKPRPLGPLSRSATEAFLKRISTQTPPIVGEKFHFYHADLGPTHILVSDDGTVTSILDWESAGYYPRFWISVKPRRSGGFNLDTEADSRYEWSDMLQTELANVGFILNDDHVAWQKTRDCTFFSLCELRQDTL